MCCVAFSVSYLNVCNSFELCSAARVVRSKIQLDFCMGGRCCVKMCLMIDGMSMGW